MFYVELNHCAELDVDPFKLVTGSDVNINGAVSKLS